MTNGYAAAAALGVLTGARSMAGLALLSRGFAAAPVWRRRRSGPPASWLARDEVAGLLGLAAVGEAIVDKLPIVPARTEPAPLLGRLAMGALAGAATAQWAGGSVARGAVYGAGGAVAGAFAAYHLRALAGSTLPVPDAVLGAAEDALVFTAGSRTVDAIV